MKNNIILVKYMLYVNYDLFWLFWRIRHLFLAVNSLWFACSSVYIPLSFLEASDNIENYSRPFLGYVSCRFRTQIVNCVLSTRKIFSSFQSLSLSIFPSYSAFSSTTVLYSYHKLAHPLNRTITFRSFHFSCHIRELSVYFRMFFQDILVDFFCYYK